MRFRIVTPLGAAAPIEVRGALVVVEAHHRHYLEGVEKKSNLLQFGTGPCARENLEHDGLGDHWGIIGIDQPCQGEVRRTLIGPKIHDDRRGIGQCHRLSQSSRSGSGARISSRSPPHPVPRIASISSLVAVSPTDEAFERELDSPRASTRVDRWRMARSTSSSSMSMFVRDISSAYTHLHHEV